ncbi:hypothetical protein FDW83_09075 [Pseudarthrobacter sp. NamE2]|uniref:hypothetical protein n=1 Tax=Pseudarthrobacter sp. NamE2 TaxID=2576838 RepID=UPI0010FE86A1|nr:hypothetical protein [Pseudarthrobacter sp. NamE2]TLM83605.1 hypothetical protein FDW83_09075 [Pseudarthrobacter sp. NamE2]
MHNDATSPDYASVRAIALDANVFKSAPGISALSSLAERADTHGRVEIWIADTVIWEWGQHLHETHVALRVAAKKLRAAGLWAKDPGDLSAHDVAGQLLDRIRGLGRSVRVVDTSPFAHEALRDQILLEGPGKRKGDVKTGAADSAHLRAYHAQASFQEISYLLVSADGDALTAHERWGHETPPSIMKSLTRAAEAVFHSVPSNAAGVQLALSVALDASSLLKDVSIGGAELGYALDHAPEDGLSMEVNAEAARFVGLVHTKQDPTAVTFTALYLADVKVVGAAFNWNPVPQEVTVSNALLRVQVSIPQGSASSKDAVVINCDMTAPVAGPWNAPREALDDIWTALSSIPGVAGVTDGGWPSAEDLSLLSKVTLGIGGEELTLDLMGSGFHAWELRCTYRGQEQHLLCYEAGEGYADSENGTVTVPFYGIAVLGTPEWSEHAEYGLNEFIFRVGIPGLTQ